MTLLWLGPIILIAFALAALCNVDWGTAGRAVNADIMVSARRSRRAGHSMWSDPHRPQTTKSSVTSTNSAIAIGRKPASH